MANAEAPALRRSSSRSRPSLQAIEATQEKNEFDFDDSALLSRQADGGRPGEAARGEGAGRRDGRAFLRHGPAVSVEPGRDVVKEFDSEFGRDAKSLPKSDDKSL